MRKDKFEIFLEAIEKMEACKGFEIDNRARQLENSFIITVFNFEYLRRMLVSVPVFSVEQKRKGESHKYQLEVLRLFINFIMSVTALRDHMRNYVIRIYGSSDKALDGKYQEKIDQQFKNDYLVQFIEDLRNYWQHYWILPIGINTTFYEDKSNSKIVLYIKELIESGYEWKKGCKFIESRKGDIEVLSLAEDYINKSIFPWLTQEQNKYHGKEFDE